MFQRFTDEGRDVVVFAQDEARTLKHNYIGTEHLLLGLQRREDAMAAQVLESLEVSIDVVRGRVLEIVGHGTEAAAGEIPFTPRAKKVLELALRESLSLGHNYIGTEHILLGLVREHEGVGARILLALGVSADAVRTETGRRIAEAGFSAEPARRRLGRQVRPWGRGPRWLSVSSDRWEYRVERPETADGLTAEWLNALGADGWSLSGVAPAELGGGLIFKRRLPWQPPPAR